LLRGNLFNHRYVFELFRAIDAAKKHLSGSRQGTIKFSPLDLSERITIEEFEEMIVWTKQKIEESIYDSLTVAAIKPEDIKRVILTGGTSQIPLLNRSIIKIFGEEKILRPNYFSSVATGLGYVAARLNK